MARRSKRAIVLLSATLSLVVASPAFAQEQPTRWSGLYLGAHGGYAWGHADAQRVIDCSLMFGITCGQGQTTSLSEGLQRSGTGPISVDGGAVGVAAGGDVQIGRTVVGAEIDLSWTPIDGRRSSSGVAPPGHVLLPPVAYSAGSGIDMDWLATLRARVGYAFSRDLLVYATGGLALARIEVSQYHSDNAGSQHGWSGSRLASRHAATKAGFAVGVGGEWRLDRNWSIKAEYLRVGFGNVVSRGNASILEYTTSVEPHTTSADLTLNIVRAGISYRF